jgi:hypothetical protein
VHEAAFREKHAWMFARSVDRVSSGARVLLGDGSADCLCAERSAIACFFKSDFQEML